MKNLKKLGGRGGTQKSIPCWVYYWLSHKETPSSKKIFKFNTNFIQRKCEKILPYAKSNYASQIRPARLFFFFLTTAIHKCSLFCFLLILFISSLIRVTSWKLYSSHPLINNEEKVNETKMYNKMYWNDIVQLIFSYTYITFCFVQRFSFYTTYNVLLQHT